MAKPELTRCGVYMVLGLAVWFVSGCGGTDRLETAEVTGKVTLDGQPLSHGTVIFAPERGRGATADNQSDGSFTLSTYRRGDGAIVGMHKISVFCTEEVVETQPNDPGNLDAGMFKMDRSLIPTKYNSPGTSGLTFEVKAKTDNVADLELSSKAR